MWFLSQANNKFTNLNIIHLQRGQPQKEKHKRQWEKTLHKLDNIGLKNYAFIATLIDLRRRCWNRNRNRSISKRSSRFVLVRIELKRMPKVDWLREWCWPSLPDLSKIFICTLCSLTAPPPLGSLLSDPIAFAYDLQLVSRSLLGTCINWRRK